ncbi:MAG: 3-hydroxyacyl-CoA dehydrogenase NAD-binding domain-containing protein [Pseudomonadota bacterium]
MTIQTVAVIGAGVMGAGIAAHLANAGAEVLLFDIVAKAGEDRTALAKRGIEALRKTKPPPLMLERLARRISPCNLEDDLARLGEADWIIEAVIERLDIKRTLFETVDQHRQPGSIVSSNTSTIPLDALMQGMPTGLRQDFLITHFFNPPRYMRLLELVPGADTRDNATEAVDRYCHEHLGKGVVRCNDTPGFIANRIGSYWVQLGVRLATSHGVSIEAADRAMGPVLGLPRTGIFGLLDLVGLDLVPEVRTSLAAFLPKDDPLTSTDPTDAIIERLIAEGYTGRKGRGGFYRRRNNAGERVDEAYDLARETYRPRDRTTPSMVRRAQRGGARVLLDGDESISTYAWQVMSKTICYAAELVPEIADDVEAIDRAMRLGYSWEQGPFEMLDAWGLDWFIHRLEAEQTPVPRLLADASPGPFYEVKAPQSTVRMPSGEYRALSDDALALSRVKALVKPITKNGSASLWDIGDDVACLEFHSKLNAIDAGTLEMIRRSIDVVGERYQGLVIHNEADTFSVGANIGLMLFMANAALWSQIDEALAFGQRALKGLRYAPFPVVGAPRGVALGGGAEILMNCDRVHAAAELYMGLVEVGVGVVPGWGGCVELLRRWTAQKKRPGGPMPPIAKAFELISLAKVSGSAMEARDSQFLSGADTIVMNQDATLASAKAEVLAMVSDYAPPDAPIFHLPGPSAASALRLVVDGFVAQGQASAHDALVARGVAEILSGGPTDITCELGEEDLLALERDVFMRLVRTPPTLARLEHMLETGKPLRN